MPEDKTVPRILQQQPRRDADSVQQQSGARAAPTGGDAKARPQQEMGEGSYQATRDYQKNIGEYLSHADVDADARQAKPRSDAEARELDQAEREGRSHSKGER